MKTTLIEDDLKITSNGRQPQNIKSGLSQQQLIGPYSIFKLSLRRPKQSVQILQMKTISIGRRPQILKVEHLSNHILDCTPILNLTLDEKIKFYKSFK